MPVRIERRPDGELVLVTGCSGSGKTLYTMRQVATAARLLVWDSHLEWSAKGCRSMGSIPDLARACATRDSDQLAYTGPIHREAFGQFCRIALCWGKLAVATVVVEELAEVTSPAKAPEAWGELLRWSRKLGCVVYGITQRPSESDKTLVGNAHRIVCHSMGRDGDARYMAAELRVPIDQVNGLDFSRLEYIERLPDRQTRHGFNRRPSRNSR